MCGKSFKSRQNLSTHTLTQHEDTYRNRCRICNKGIQDKKLLAAHQKTHDIGSVGSGIAHSFLVKDHARLCDELQAARVRKRQECESDGACRVAAKDRNNPSRVFACAGGCGHTLHWECVGYTAELSALPVLICPICLEASGRSSGAASVALANRRMIEAYAAKMQYQIVTVPLDGSCLFSSVAKGTGRSVGDLLNNALQALLTIDIPEHARANVHNRCKELLKRPRRNLKDDWNSELCDYLPRAIASVIGCALHIHEVMGGEIKIHVIMPSGGEAASDAATREPVLLMRSFAEIGVPHYDLMRTSEEEEEE